MASRVENTLDDLRTGGFGPVVREQRADGNIGLRSVEPRGRNEDPRRSVVGRRDVQRAGGDQMHVAVDASEEGVVGREGRNVGVVRVVGAYLQQIVSGVYKLGHIERECRVTAGMRTGLHAVHVDLGMRIDRFEQ